MLEKHVRFAAVNLYPYYEVVKENNRTRYVGILTHLVDAMAAGFRSFEYVPTGLSHPGTEISPGNFTGAMGMFMRNEADIYAAQWVTEYTDFQTRGYSTAFDEASFGVLSGPPRKMNEKFVSLYSSFNLSVWLCMGFTWIVVATTYSVLSTLAKEWGITDYKGKGIFSSLLMFYALLSQKGFENLPFSASLRLLTIGWILLGYVLMTVFGGSLSSRLSVMDVPEYIDSLEDIIKFPELRPYIVESLIADKYIQFSDLEKHKVLWNQIVKTDGLRPYNWFYGPGALEEIHSGDAVVITNRDGVIPNLIGVHCDSTRKQFHIAKETFCSVPIVVIYRKDLDTDIVEVINQRLTHYGSMGFPPNVWRRNGQKSFPCLSESHSRSVNKALTPRDLAQVFVSLLVGLSTSCIAFIAELIFKYKHTH